MLPQDNNKERKPTVSIHTKEKVIKAHHCKYNKSQENTARKKERKYENK
jgi:hypothetical protein